ncbi:hypothetical protein T07_9044 [Trichinella nelsoni]|uniref:Uncharacterized protein n=1 Tax=Trichinella nelsoni TaxID=6336 RepID=A0A0V0RES0_9BILA|nr:hypothetical protein T07_9044 [Trichinella nelsoni]
MGSTWSLAPVVRRRDLLGWSLIRRHTAPMGTTRTTKIGKFIVSNLCKMCWNYVYVEVERSIGPKDDTGVKPSEV